MLDLATDLPIFAFVAAFFVFKAGLLVAAFRDRREPAVVRVRPAETRRPRR